MMINLWGSAGRFSSLLPDSGLGIFLLLLFLVSTVLVFQRHWHEFRTLSANQRNWFLLLCTAAVLSTAVFSTLFTLTLPRTTALFSLFTAVPLILAPLILPTALATVVGMLIGLTFGITVTGGLFDAFHFGLAAYCVSWLVKQPYSGRLYDTLRNPPVTGMIGMGITAVLLGITVFLLQLPDDPLPALDQATYAFSQTFFTRAAEGLVGGMLAWIIIQWLPEAQPPQGRKLPPPERSIGNRLLWDLVIFSTLLSTAVLILVFSISVNVSKRLVVNQMANTADLVSRDIPDFYNALEDLTLALSDNNIWLEGSPEQQAAELADIHKTGDIFSDVLLVDESETLLLAYPANQAQSELSEGETALLNQFFVFDMEDNLSVTDDQAELLSFMVPIGNNGNVELVLIGRVDQFDANELIFGVDGEAGNSSGFIVDEESRIIAHTDPLVLDREWGGSNGRILPTVPDGTANGAYQERDAETEQRQLVYFLQDSNAHPWTVVITAPYTAALNLATAIGLPLFGVLLAATALSGLYLRNQTAQITRPIVEIATASQEMADNRNWLPANHLSQRSDEIGQLTRSFEKMQRAIKNQMSESMLLLAISREVSLNLDLEKGMNALLRGILKGTQATGARALVVSPTGGKPLTFGEGTLSQQMAAYDRRIMSQTTHQTELVCQSPQKIYDTLNIEPNDLPFSALIALPLKFKSKTRGALWLAYPHNHFPDASERKFLSTLANQAAILAGNAHLFALAESGRRRLSAVLASTREPVIVTDPTDRILIINPAFESLFKVSFDHVRNRSVSSVIQHKPLRKALIGQNEHQRNIEIALEDGRVFYASVSLIKGVDNQPFGRVAVLHDITHLKEIDELKSDFVQTVSHDLKNPLTFMSGYVSMLSYAGEMNEKQNEYIEKINNGIAQMTQLVTDLLDLGRIEAGVDLQHETFRIEPLLTSIKDEYFMHAHMAGNKIRLELEENLPSVRGDLALIRQAATNLVSNAIKYAPNSGEILLSAKRGQDNLIISVKDNGPGLTSEEQIRLFEKFYRVKRPGTERVKGSGLGLAIVRSVAERHGGRAGCYSQQGEGATFFIALPYLK